MYAQTEVTGKVVDAVNNEPIPGVNVKIIGGTTGASTDFDGLFSINTTSTPPFTLEFTSVGFDRKTFEVNNADQEITITLQESQTTLDEVVVSASRTPERIFESPVTVETMSLKDIKNTASPDFYDGLENLKGVDINTNSLTFKSINTRGFSTFSNTRFMQLVDGMDNSAPALNFPLGNLLGMTETDVHSIELLPGASSALYGANAFNGILFMTSKNPFDFHGVSASVKAGVTSQDVAGTNFYYDVSARYGIKFNEKIAAKINLGYLKGTDWHADNQEDRFIKGNTRANYNYDGTNVYGDEASANIRAASGGLGIIPDVIVSRTGYRETTLTEYNAESFKADWGVYIRPWENDVEFSYVGKYGSGNTIYQGTNRYNIKNFNMQQHKLEVRSNNFFVRGYVVADDAGDSYDMLFTAINVNRRWKSDTQWFGEYIQTFAGATLGGATEAQAHQAARAAADTGRFEPGSPEFKNAFNEIIKDPDFLTGSKFQDESKFYHGDANYNFSHLWDWADIQVGGSYRMYELNSKGSIYTDKDGPIDYSEYGAYAQLQKKFLAEERLKLTASVRYDKSELFDGFFSPRLSLGYTAGQTQNHNFRGSIQTGFRNPTTQDLFIGLDAGRAVLVGSAKSNLDRDIRNYDVSQSGQNLGVPAQVNVVGRQAYENSFSVSSVQSGAPQASDINLVKPEQVTSFELGYRGKYNRIIVDLNAYYNRYKDFISNENVLVPLYGTVGDNSLSLAALQFGDVEVYQTYTNSDADVNSYGGSISLSTKVFGNYDISGNYTFAKQDFDQAKYPDFRTSFNTPEHKVKMMFGNPNVYENFGFNVAWRWSDAYFWQATFGDGDIPSYHTMDAQVNYALPSLKSVIKVGASNLFGQDYFTAFGTGFVGSQYYVSWVVGNF
jgi:outer membrane receptor for ferrienterochelin and colicin